MMNSQARLTPIFITILWLLLIPVAALAQNDMRIYIPAEQLSNIQVGQPTTVEVLVENASAVYGAEFHIQFDAVALEIVEMSHGDFLSADPDNEAFVLQNEFDNSTGTIDYAVSLLNPAPPVEGNGVLLHITFNPKVAGPVTLQFVDGLFGTQQGEEVLPVMEDVTLTIAPDNGQSPTQVQLPAEQTSQGQPASRRESFRGDAAGSDNSATILGLSIVFGAIVIGMIGLFIVATLIGVWFWVSRSRQNKRSRKASALS